MVFDRAISWQAALGLRRTQALLPVRHSNYQGIDQVGKFTAYS